MSKRANPTAIGAFVLGATAILLVAIAYFGSTSLFGKDQVSFVCFFEDSVDGLQIGSKVKLKGVPIGDVTQILIRFDSEHGTTGGRGKPSIPVIIQVDVARLSRDLGMDVDLRNEAVYHAQIQEGLRATLGNSNLLTGILQVNLDYKEDATDHPPLRELTNGGMVFREIPTLPSDLKQATQDLMGVVSNISEMDLKGLVEDLSSALEKISTKIDQLEIDGVNEAMISFKERVESPKIDETLDSFNEAAVSLKAVADKLDGQIGENQVEEVLTAATDSLESLKTTADNVGVMVEQNDNLPQDLSQSIREIGDAAREVTEFFAYLEERPNALIFGRKDKKEEAEGDHVPFTFQAPDRRPSKVRRKGAN